MSDAAIAYRRPLWAGLFTSSRAWTKPDIRRGLQLTLAAIWLVFVFVLRSRHQRELKQEVDQLNQMESRAAE